jgi:anti-sigma regulatory factor (Ser/Thr protein kinase)
VTALRHDALIYDSDSRFVDVLMPFVADGLAAGEQVCVVTRERNGKLLREAVGCSAEQVEFIDAIDWYRHPARTIAGYHRTIQAAWKAGAPGLRVVGEVEFGATVADHAAWARYESALNATFADEPVWIICPYDARRLPAQVVETARRTHTCEVSSGERRHSDRYLDPGDFVAALPLPAAGTLVVDLELHGARLQVVRALVAVLARHARLSTDRTIDLQIAVGELATNALVHGRPPARFRAWRHETRLTFDITDSGTGPLDPIAGFRPPMPDAVGGVGLWLARQFTDQLEITTTARGTTARFSIDA